MKKWFQVPDNVDDLDDTMLCNTHTSLQGDLSKLRFGGPVIVLVLIGLALKIHELSAREAAR